MTTLLDLLDRAAGGDLGGVRLVDRQRREVWLPWRELGARADRVAAGLAAWGVAPGERVPIVYPTGEEVLSAFFGVVRAGAVPAVLAPPLRLGGRAEYAASVGAMLRTLEPRLALVDARSADRLRAAIELAGLATAVEQVEQLEQLAGGDSSSEPAPRPLPADLALVQFSSGTTVAPKAIALSHRALVAQLEILDRQWPALEPGTVHRGVSWLPLYHDMGLVGGLLAALARPGELVLLAPETFVARPASWLQAIARHRATLSAAPDFAYALATERIRDEELEGCDLSCWRVALDGAEPIDPGVLRAFAERFARWGFRPTALTPVYGLAEASLAVTFTSTEQAPTLRAWSRTALAAGRAEPSPVETGRELVSVGAAVDGFELEVRDERGRALAERCVGELFIRGPSLMEGYLGDASGTAEVLVDGWLATGDLGFLDHGALWLVGRAKDLLIVRGRNHAPEDLELAVRELPSLSASCAVSWRANGADGEQLALLCELAPLADRDRLAALEETVRGAVLARCGLRLGEVVWLGAGALPRTSSGKLRRAAARDAWLAGELPLEPVGPARVPAVPTAAADSRR